MKKLLMHLNLMIVCTLLPLGSAHATTTNNALPRLVVQTGHASSVRSVAFSANGRSVVSGDSDNIIKIWDVNTGRLLWTLVRPIEGVKKSEYKGLIRSVTGSNRKNGVYVRFSPDGRFVVSYYSDNKVVLWDTATGLALHTISVDTAFTGFTRDNKFLLFQNKGNTVLMDVVTGHFHTESGEKETVSSIDQSIWLSPEGKIKAKLDQYPEIDYLKIVDVDSGATLKQLTESAPVRIRNDFAHRMGGERQGVNCVAFSPDGKLLISGGDSECLTLWEVATGSELRTLSGGGDWVTSIAVSKDGKNLLSGNADNLIRLWDLTSGQGPRVIGKHQRSIYGVAFSPDSKIIASVGEDYTLNLWDIGSGIITSVREIGLNPSVAFSPDGNHLFVGSRIFAVNNRSLAPDPMIFYEYSPFSAFSPDNKTIILAINTALHTEAIDDDFRFRTGNIDIVHFDLINQRVLWRTNKVHDNNYLASLAFSPNGKYAISGGYDNLIRVWDASTGKELRSLAGHKDAVTSVAYSPDGRYAISGSKDKTIKRWDMVSGHELNSLVGHDNSVSSVAFSPGGDVIISGADDKSIKFWRASDGKILATLFPFSADRWAVTDPEGRFDTSNLEDMPFLHWVMPDDPLTPVPLEAFMKDYYEPSLLPRILNGEKFKPVRALMDLNRVQPEVKIVKVTPDSKDPERALVEVELTGARKEYERAGNKVTIATSVHDLRLFRDGQLVGHADGQVAKYSDNPYRKTFAVHLPSTMSGKEITFSAYAFNDDRVKSATVRQTYKVPDTVVARKGNAYIINMGVNRFDNPAWNLNFAANDARLMRKILSDKLQKTGAYQQIVPLSLISDQDEHQADKALLHAILNRLAGMPASPLLKELSGAEQLQPATPDDLVLLTFAGHGYADGNGDFYLLTQDTGKGNDKRVDDELLKRSISSEELSQWLRDVDAGDMTLIVDACQSAASVEGKDFKPGPMGSRGLGQLSFDKGMSILAASQADEYALEDDKIKQGLLTFALITNGIGDFEADNSPKDQKIMLDEWLRYGVNRVPGLAEEVRTGKVNVETRRNSRSVVLVKTIGTNKPRPAQQPVLFDFAKKRRQIEVAGQ